MKLFLTVFIAMTFDDILSSNVDPHRVLDAMSSAIGTSVLECKNEIKFSDRVIHEFLSYWDPEHELTFKEMGCVFFCVIIKLELVEAEGALKKDNAVGFCKANGADDEMITALMAAYDGCRHTVNFTEPCATGLRLSSCFRKKVFDMNWAPEVGAHYYDSEF